MYEFVKVIEESAYQEPSGAWYVITEFKKNDVTYFEHFKMVEHASFAEVANACANRVAQLNAIDGEI